MRGSTSLTISPKGSRLFGIRSAYSRISPHGMMVLIPDTTPDYPLPRTFRLQVQSLLAMESYVNIILYLALAEFIRRCCLILINGLTGPLSKIPGPFLARFTTLPWSYQLITGNHMNSVGPLVQKYGDIVRVGKNPFPRFRLYN